MNICFEGLAHFGLPVRKFLEIKLFKLRIFETFLNRAVKIVRLLYAFLWATPRRLNFICRRFGTLCLFHLHRQVGMKKFFFILHTYLPLKMEQTECSETSEYKIQTPGNYPEESIQHSEHSESLKSRIVRLIPIMRSQHSALPRFT